MIAKTEKQINWLIIIASGILFIISEFQSINLFAQVSTVPLFIAFFVSLSIVYGAARVASFVLAIIFGIKGWTEYLPEIKKGKPRRKLRFWLPAAGFAILYLAFASFMILASIGFTASHFAEQETAYQEFSTTKNNNQAEYDSLKEAYDIALKLKKRVVDNERSSQDQIDQAIAGEKRTKNELNSFKKPIEKKTESLPKPPTTIFDSITSVTKGNQEHLKGYMLALMSILLELLLQMTNAYLFISEWLKKRNLKNTMEDFMNKKEMIENKTVENEPTLSNNEKINYRQVIKDDYEKIIQYLDAMLDIPIGLKRVNSNDKIMEKTGLRERECEIYKRIFNSVIKRGGKFLVNTVKGSSDANFSKDIMIDSIKSIAEGKI
jgi:hypothetical protein